MLGCPLCDVDHSRGSTDCPATRIGRTVGARYHIERLIGVGGMGAVYEARHLELGSRVALKMLHPRMVTNTQLAARFRVEAQKAADIRHPGIVDVRDLGQDESGCPFMAMELLDGTNLEALIERGPVPIDRAVAITAEALEALAAAHARGVIHRDLKPANLFLARDARGATVVKILDFGIAKVVADGAASMTRTGLTMGTVEYMSPEQIRDSKSIDARADLYSMGVTLYEMLTGRRNTSGDTPIEVIARVVQGQVERHPAAVRPEVPAWLDAVVARALDPSVEGRFATAEQMLSALRSASAMGVAQTLHAMPQVSATVIASSPTPMPATTAMVASPMAAGYSSGSGTTAWAGAVPSAAPFSPTHGAARSQAPAAAPTQHSGGGRGGMMIAIAVVVLLGGVVAIAAVAIVLRRGRSAARATVASASVATSVTDTVPAVPPSPSAPSTPPAAPVMPVPTAVAPSAVGASPAPPPPSIPSSPPAPPPAAQALAPQPLAVVPSQPLAATPAVQVAQPIMTLADYAGTFAISGHLADDGCNRGVYLAARRIVVDDVARTMFANVVRRTYQARVENGRLIAEGTFPNPLCRRDRLAERWVFERTPTGLAGTLESRWALPPRCSSPCTAGFALTAIPAAARPARRRSSGGSRAGGGAAY